MWKIEQSRRTPPYGVELETAVCTIQFHIPNDIGPSVLLYYRLTNFYQNHRRYVKSIDTSQLSGSALSNGTIGGSSCDPLKLAPNGKAYYPCGLIANSLFNDTINSPVALNPQHSSGGATAYNMTNQGIAWSSDADLYKKTQYTRDQVMPPPNWEKRYPNGYTEENDIPNLSTYEEFQVWMRTAGLPTFSKLALRNDNDVMQSGDYTIEIFDCEWTMTYCEPRLLTKPRLPSDGLWRHQVNTYINKDGHGRQKSLPRDCLCCGGRYLHCFGSGVHDCPSHQAKVSRNDLPLLKCFRVLTL